MSERIKTVALLIGFACMTALAFLGMGAMIGYQRGVAKCRTETVTDTVVATDTIVVNHFHTDTIVETRFVPHTFVVRDTVEKVDSVVVALPIESHHCHMEDTADIWYSGFAAMLDSVKIYDHTTTITKTERVEVPKTPFLTLGVGAGAMYHERQVNPYLIGEVRCNARKTAFSAFGVIDNGGRWGAGVNVTYRMDVVK